MEPSATSGEPGVSPASSLNDAVAAPRRLLQPLQRCPRLSEYLFALRVALWLCAASWLLRAHALPQTLDRISPRHPPGRPRIPVDRAVVIIERVCGLALFRHSFFPRICLRRSLALYHFLGVMGYAARLHVGVRKQAGRLEGHSWVSLGGRRIADATTATHFQELYNHPPSTRGPRSSRGPGPWRETGGGTRHETRRHASTPRPRNRPAR